jgi:hypothetical protein
MSKAKKNKTVYKLTKEFDYYHRKVEEMEQERDSDRSWETKALLKTYKKIKLTLKTQLVELEKKLNL